MINWNKIKIRCSGISKILSESRECPSITPLQLIRLNELQEKPVLTAKQTEEFAWLVKKKENGEQIILSDTCTSYLLEVYAWEKYQKESISSDRRGKAVEKGKLVEDDSITLLSLVDKVMYVKNSERIYNEYLSGEPDIRYDKRIIDIKSNFDVVNFLSCISRPLFKGYKQQVNGYMDIDGAEEGEVAYCLVDAPRSMVNDEMKRMFYKMDVATEENPFYKKAAEQLVRNMTFGDIPMHRRVYKVPVEKIEMEPVYERVLHCRKWLKDFEEIHENLNK